MAYDPNDPLEMIKAEAREEGMDVSDDVLEARHAAARAMLAALEEARARLQQDHDHIAETKAGRTSNICPNIRSRIEKADAAIARAKAAGISPDKAAG